MFSLPASYCRSFALWSSWATVFHYFGTSTALAVNIITRGAQTRSFIAEPGHVYFVATPIGNLGDITRRALDVLSSADVICAEDTRHTINLLRYFEIEQKELISHHEHNWSEKVPHIIRLALSGKSVAVVSDAGTPGISDPGFELASECYKNKIRLHPIPGPSAVAAALSVCGFPASEFTFLGFLPVKGKERVSKLNSIARCPHTVVFFEAPHRVIATMRELQDSFGQGNRPCICCREITKIYEEYIKGTVTSCYTRLSHTVVNDHEEEDDTSPADKQVSINHKQIDIYTADSPIPYPLQPPIDSWLHPHHRRKIL